MIKILTDVSAEAILQKVNTIAGSLSSLSTTDKTNLVTAINEIFSSVGTLSGNVGTLSSLSTSAKTSLVAAINELFSHDGTLSSLSTSTKTSLVAAINEIFAYTKVLKESSGAGLHNSLYRGKNIGTSLSSAQSSAIRAGTFDDMWIGDFWVIGGVTYRIADFDYYLHSGDTECTTHHVVVVPDTTLYTAQMNTTDTTAGGYVGSAMYKTSLASAKTTFTNAFGSGHILTHREFLINAVKDGVPGGGAWYDSTVELMDERMVYGATQWDSGHPDGSVAKPWDTGKFFMYSVSCKQLNLFRLRPDLMVAGTGSNRKWWWLRNVVSAACFARVASPGHCSNNGASNSGGGVRPAALIY